MFMQLKCLYTVLSSYNCTHVCDFSRGITRFCNHGPRRVKAVVHDHEWFKSMCGLKAMRGTRVTSRH